MLSAMTIDTVVAIGYRNLPVPFHVLVCLHRLQDSNHQIHAECRPIEVTLHGRYFSKGMVKTIDFLTGIHARYRIDRPGTSYRPPSTFPSQIADCCASYHLSVWLRYDESHCPRKPDNST